MGKVHDALDDDLARFVCAQHVFFVATAPSGDGGHVNLSPKGLDTFRVLDLATVAYLDLTGSGVETIAHVRQNGRVTLLFCAFAGAPKIVRLYGAGEVVVPGDVGFDALAERFPARRGARAVIRVRLSRVAVACGYSVPLMAYERDRDVLDTWTAGKDDDGLARYQDARNALSIDALPGLPRRR